jgi:uncharacterized repeat protein (TIGR03833 family)
LSNDPKIETKRILYMDKKTLTGTIRKNIQIDSEVNIVQKHHQRSGELTQGFVKKILTSSPSHPHGIKVMLDTGEVGRVAEVFVSED